MVTFDQIRQNNIEWLNAKNNAATIVAALLREATYTRTLGLKNMAVKDDISEWANWFYNLEPEFDKLLKNEGNEEDLKKVNYKLQELTDNAREGVASNVEDYQEVTEKVPGASHKINEAKKTYNRRAYAERKATKQAEAELDHALGLQHEEDMASL